MNALLQDVRYAFRMLANHPGYTAIALITLALGIGVNTALFSFVNAMRMIPQRFAEPESLVFLWEPREGQDYPARSISALDYLDWREQATAFTDLALCNERPRFLTDEGEPERVRVMQATGNLLPMLGITTQIGRLHTVEEDSVGAEGVVVLSDRFWQRRLGGRADVVGRNIWLNDKAHTIIGVLESKADFEQFSYVKIDLLAPLRVDPTTHQRGQRWFRSIARLKPGTTVEQAQTEMNAIAARLASAYPDTNADVNVWVQPLEERYFSPSDRLASYALLGAVGCVLLIACMNLANLLLAKATSRGREFAVRAALGAGRARIIRQLLTESLLLALLGGALGLLAGVWAVDFFVASQPDYLPFQQEELGLHTAILFYTLILSVLAALIFGLAPALTASRLSLSETLKEGGAAVSAGVSRNRLRSGLVVGQLAISLPLIICAGLVIRHIIALKSVDVGFNTERLLVMQIDLPAYRYGTDTSRTSFFRDAVATSNATAGVSSAAAVNFVPLGGSRASVDLRIEGREVVDDAHQDFAGLQIVTPGYFQTMGIPILRGRALSDLDHAEAQRVVVVNKRMAEHYWPDEDAVGKRFKLGEGAPEERWITVVGVVGDTGHSGLYQPPRPEIFFPHQQRPSANMVIVARTLGDPKGVVPALRSAITDMDAGLPVYGVRTMAEILHRWLRDDRSAVAFLSGLAVLALSLASVGLYGVMSYSVAQRTHEIGVRVALGAGSRAILRLVIRRCLTLAGVGVGIGLALSAGVGVILESQLYGVSGIDPVTFIGVAMLLLVVALLAGYLPALRATKIDPMVALRYE